MTSAGSASRVALVYPHVALNGVPYAAAELYDIRDAITVDAWVFARRSGGEAIEALVSRWSQPPVLQFAAFDAGATDGLASKGYFGAVCDGRYVYFCPQHSEDTDTHGVVLRYDTHSSFRAASSYAAYDAGRTAGLATRGYYGAGFDGRFVYFVPRQLGLVSYHSHLLRYDTLGDFRSSTSWDAYDIGLRQSSQGCAFDGRYLYLCPGFADTPTRELQIASTVVRVDTTGDLHDPATYRRFVISALLGPRAGCFDGATFDGRFVYFVPLQTSMAVRYDTSSPFESPDGWSAFDAATVGMGMCVGAVFDGRFVYYVPYNNPRVVRFDTLRAFDQEGGAWACFDAAGMDGLKTEGFDGGFFDGWRVHFIPFIHTAENRHGYRLHGNWLSYDPTKPFDDRRSWTGMDAGRTDDMPSVGYNGGAFDGRFFYASPWRSVEGSGPGNLGVHGRVLRVDTLGDDGAFSLRYGDCGHNGGLCAAVTGPTFMVNTTAGVRFVAARQVPEPGWHHLVGTYGDGGIALYLDGALVASCNASGPIQSCSAPLMIGRLEHGTSVFEGVVQAVTVHSVVRDAAWVAQRYASLLGS